MLSAISSGVESVLDWVDGASESNAANIFLHGNFGPVKDELRIDGLPVVGEIPDFAHGTFLRNGPNPAFPPLGNYHWFDGDGMIHAMHISKDSEGKSVASYSRRYVQTHRLIQENAAGQALFMKIGDTYGRLGMFKAINLMSREAAGIIDNSNGEGTANTNIFSAKTANGNWRTFALQEQDLPYEMKILDNGDLETVGRLPTSSTSTKISYASQLYTAHPKTLYYPSKDGQGNEDMLIAFAYGVDPRVPALVYHRHRLADMSLEESCPVDLGRENGSMMHDFAVTRKYAIFFDLPLLFNLAGMLSQGTAISFDKTQPSRFGFAPIKDYMPRSIIRPLWIQTETCYIFHSMAAWDDVESDFIVNLIACRMDEIDLRLVSTSTVADTPHVCFFQFNLMTETCRWKKILSDSAVFGNSILGTSQGSFHAGLDGVEFPVIHPDLTGLPPSIVKVAFAAVLRHESKLESCGIVKFNLEAASMEKDACDDFFLDFIPFGESKVGGEAFYVPKRRFTGDGDGEGLLMTFVYDKNSGNSTFVAYNAATMNPEPVFSIQLPVRVPYGFHGTWVPGE